MIKEREKSDEIYITCSDIRSVEKTVELSKNKVMCNVNIEKRNKK